MKCWVLLVLLACSTRPTTDDVPPPAGPATERAPTAGHGAMIALFAITDDGRAAITQDAIGGTRLWPILDGEREPIIVRMAVATQLVIGRDGAGFVIAGLDEVGGAELLQVTARGTVASRVRIAPEPAIEAIAIGAQGLLAMRADQTLSILSPRGEQLARLAAPARSRMKQLVTRNGRVLVLFAHDTSMYGRWVAATAWGEMTPDFMIDPRSVAMLSPNGKRLLIDFESAAYLLDAQTGRIIENYGAATPVGFVDDATVVVVSAGTVMWRPVGGKYGSERAETAGVIGPLLAGDGIAINAKEASLVLHTRDQVQQLGYAIGDVVGMHALGNQVIVSGGGRVAMQLDDALEQRAVLALPDDDRTLTDVVPIDDRFVIATHTLSSGSWGALSVIDLEHDKTQQTTMHALVRNDIRYEPSTQLLDVTDRETSYLSRWDPTHDKFETWYVLAGGRADVHLLDPRINDSSVAITLRSKDGGKLEISEIAGTDLKVGAPIEPRRHYFVAGSALAVDKLGTVYVNDSGVLIGYRHGVETMRITNARSAELAVHPGGAYIAVHTHPFIQLFDGKGALRWEIAAPLAQRIAWLGNDLVVDYAGGLGKIDAATGALIKRACGWSFGLRALSTNDLLAGDSICDAQ